MKEQYIILVKNRRSSSERVVADDYVEPCEFGIFGLVAFHFGKHQKKYATTQAALKDMSELSKLIGADKDYDDYYCEIAVAAVEGDIIDVYRYSQSWGRIMGHTADLRDKEVRQELVEDNNFYPSYLDAIMESAEGRQRILSAVALYDEWAENRIE